MTYSFSYLEPVCCSMCSSNCCFLTCIFSNAKVGSEESPGVTGKFVLGIQNEAGRRLIEFCQESALVIASTPFQQHMDVTWTSSDGQHQNQIDYILCSQRWRSSIQSAKTRPGADCGSDHEILITKFRLKLKKVKKSTRPFRYDLNQIPYDYTVSQFSHSVRSNSLRPRESQHARPPCPSPTPGVHSDSRPSSQ